MRDITVKKRELEKKFARRFCNVFDVNQCPNKSKCTCKIAAEIKAYINDVLSTPFIDLTLDDFNGKDNNGRQLIASDVAVKAKEKVIQYCWKGVSLRDIVGPDKLRSTQLDNRSYMDFRRQNGTNVVIYADSENGNSPKGKTFIASLIMREAIKRRAFPGHSADIYEWLEHEQLVNLLRKDAQGNKEIIIADNQYADWLVVDDIPSKLGISVRGMLFTSSLLDPFFFERIQEKLPTILVFKFDITKTTANLEQKFGIAINKIINDPKTFKISLCNGRQK
jgi:hypothetical protein